MRSIRRSTNSEQAVHRFLLFLASPVLRAITGILVVVPLTTYYLEPADFGVAALLTAVTTFVTPLASSGTGWVLGAYFFEITPAERKILLFNLSLLEIGFRLIVVLLLWILAPLLLPRLITPFESHYLIFFHLILVSLLANSLWPMMSHILILEKRAFSHALIEFVEIVISLVTVVVVVLLCEKKAFALYLPSMVASLVSLLMILVLLRKMVYCKPQAFWLLCSMRIGLPSIPGNVLDNFINAVDRFVVQAFAGLSQVGIYAHSRVYWTIFSLFGKTFNKVVNPHLLVAFAQAQPLDFLSLIIGGWMRLMAAGGMLLTLFVSDVLRILTHGKFVAAAPLIIVWYVMLVVQVGGIPFTQFIVQRKQTVALMWINVSSAAALFVMMLIGAAWMGLLGVAIGICVGSSLNQVMRILYAQRSGCEFKLLPAFIYAPCMTMMMYIWITWMEPTVVIRIILAMVIVSVAMLWAVRIWLAATRRVS